METQPLRPLEEIAPYTTSSSNSEHITRPTVPVLSGKSHSDDDSRFVCNVCLDPVKDPVVTLCGHLYCWPCLFRWLNTGHTTCPVCKAGVSKENVIPLFIRGSEQDPRLTCSTSSEVPNRPNARRPAPIASTFGQNQLGGHPIGAAQIAGLSFSSTGFGFFPSLFGLQFQSFVPPPPAQQIFGRVLTREEDQQVKLSRILVGIGLFLIICLLVF